MTMQNFTHVKVQPKGRAEAFGAARVGFLDGLAGRPFAERYETAHHGWQINYELGRMWATSFVAAWVKPPAWPKNVIRPKSLLVEATRVNMLGGISATPRRQPPA